MGKGIEKAEGRNFSKKERQEVVETLLQISNKNKGILNPRKVVDVARDPDSILHKYFDWDDTVAAEKWRLHRARDLILKVNYTIERVEDDGKVVEFTTRRFQSRKSNRGAGGGYETLEDIMKNKKKRTELLQQITAELTSYRKRYAQMFELQAVWVAIDQIVEAKDVRKLGIK